MPRAMHMGHPPALSHDKCQSLHPMESMRRSSSTGVDRGSLQFAIINTILKSLRIRDVINLNYHN